MVSRDDRIEREKIFHNDAYESHSRSNLSIFYPECSPIRRRYETYLLERCEDKDVLEYGCGLGSYAFDLSSKGSNVTGIDISEFAIREAKTRAMQNGLKIDFQVMDAEQLKFANESFDVVCGSSILHHLNLERAIEEIMRVLRPGGKAIFVEPLSHNLIIALFRKLTPRLRSSDEHPLTMREMQVLCGNFSRHVVEHYYLLALGAFLFHSLKHFPEIMDALNRLDQRIFARVPLLKKYSWQVLLVMEK